MIIFEGLFTLLAYLLCSIQFDTFIKKDHEILHIYEYLDKKIVIFLRKSKHFETIIKFLDIAKCPIFVILSAIFFRNKETMCIVATASYLGHYYPIWNNFHNTSKNFFGIIITGFILQPVTGIFMIGVFIITIHRNKYASLAISYAMVAGIIKTIVHAIISTNVNYWELLFFLFFGVFAIFRNRKIIIFLLAKASQNFLENEKKRAKIFKKSSVDKDDIDDISREIHIRKQYKKIVSKIKNKVRQHKNKKWSS